MLDLTRISHNPTDLAAMDAVNDYPSEISHIINRPWNCQQPTFGQFCDQWLFSQFAPDGPLLDIGFADHTCDLTSPAWRHGRLRAIIANCCGLDLNAERVHAIQQLTNLERLFAGDWGTIQLSHFKIFRHLRR